MKTELMDVLRAVMEKSPDAIDRARSMLEMLISGGFKESLDLNCNVDIVLCGPDGEVKERREIHNTICTVGKNLLLASGGTAEYTKQFSYIAIGTGTNASASSDTALQTETARALSTVSNPTAATLQFTYTFPAGTGTGAVTESGLLDAVSTGNILARQVFSVVNKAAGDTLAVTWTIS